MNKIIEYFDEIFPNPQCELIRRKDYEFLISIMLSAQAKDSEVNKVTEVLFKTYPTIEALNQASDKDIQTIIKEIGNYYKKTSYIKEITTKLINDNVKVLPNNREYLESLKGVGRKSASLFLNEVYHQNNFPVDTHVERVSKRLNLVNEEDNILEVERKLLKLFPDNPRRIHHQFVLFGRYYCKSIHPKCNTCPLKEQCKKK